jgi:hypothetical protein
VVGADEDRIRRGSSSDAQITVEGEHMRMVGSSGKRGVRVQDVDRIRHKGPQIKSRATDLCGIEPNQLNFGYLRSRGRQQCDPVAQFRQPSRQPDDDSLGPAIATHGETAMSVERNVHAGAMYRAIFTVAKGRPG